MSLSFILITASLISVGCIIECSGSYAGAAEEINTKSYEGGSGPGEDSTEAPSPATPSGYGSEAEGGGDEVHLPAEPSGYGGGTEGGAEASTTAAPSGHKGGPGEGSTEAPTPAEPTGYGSEAEGGGDEVHIPIEPSGHGGGTEGGGAEAPTTAVPSGYKARRRCYPKAQRYDKSRRLCKCSSDGSKWDCFRQRKEFTTMTKKEKKRYIQVYREISRPSNEYHKEFSELIAIHKALFMTSIHDRNNFLAWHRWYLLQIENLLRKIDCRVTLPYWDWSVVSGDPWIEELWNNGTYTGFGGNGAKELGYCVPSGPFSKSLDWQPASSNQRGCVQRYFRGNPPDIVAVEELLKTPADNVTDFELELRIIFHNKVHCVIGGTMCSLDSASAPEFFLHHAFIDKLWDDWQQKSEDHRNAFFYELTEVLPGTGGLLPRDLLDNANLPGGVKVEYLDINDTETQTVRKRLRKLSSEELMEISRTDFEDKDEGVDEISMEVFKVKPYEKKRAKKRIERLRPKNKKGSTMMKNRRDKQRGFDIKDLEKVEKLHRKNKRPKKTSHKSCWKNIKGPGSKKRPNRKNKKGSGRRKRPKTKPKTRLPYPTPFNDKSTKTPTITASSAYGGITEAPSTAAPSEYGSGTGEGSTAPPTTNAPSTEAPTIGSYYGR